MKKILFYFLLFSCYNYQVNSEELQIFKITKDSVVGNQFVTNLDQNYFLINCAGQIFDFDKKNLLIGLHPEIKKEKNGGIFSNQKNNIKCQSKNFAIFSHQDYLITIFNKEIIIIDSRTKNILWKYKNNYDFDKRILIDNGNLFLLTSNGEIQSRSIQTGRLNWYFQKQLGGVKVTSTPKLFFFKNKLMAFYGNGELISFDKFSGENNFGENKNYISQLNSNFFFPVISSDAEIQTSILIRNNKNSLIFSMGENKVISNLEDELYQWAFYKNNNIYAINKSGKLFIIDGRTGKQTSNFDLLTVKSQKDLAVCRMDNLLLIQNGGKEITTFNLENSRIGKQQLNYDKIISCTNNKIIFKRGQKIFSTRFEKQ